jgi:dipeptidyl aminopeptidase/acylaminoacyl peptidase
MLKMTRNLLRGFDPITWAGDIRIPVLLLHGGADAMVSPSSSVRFFHALTHCKDKHIKIVPNIGHDVSCLAEAGASVKRFLEGATAD